MKAIVVHDASGRIKSVDFVADGVGYEAESGEQTIEIDPGDIGFNLDPSGHDSKRLHEYAKKMVEDFRVAHGKVVRR
jgi:hypothetical protein